MSRNVPMPPLVQPGQTVWVCINKHGRIVHTAMTEEEAAKGSEYLIHRKLRKVLKVLVAGVMDP